MPDIKKLLVANRGEIALRIMRTCEDMGISTVAVYSEADRSSPHVRYADEAYLLGPGPAALSYLNMEKIIEVAGQSKVDAIHPGYGFLSENAEFNQLCRSHGFGFIGPQPHLLRSAGDKVKARKLVADAGVPVIPGADREVRDLAEVYKLAEELGYPLVVKPSGGGGGKGIRYVKARPELEKALAEGASEAMASFRRSSVYIEKQLLPVRHIEIQLLADHFGNVVYLGERECSVQRRFQKLVEEAPSTAVDDDLRYRMGEASVRAVKAVGCENACTVEFLVDTERNFYFMETNIRLQVEHTVTESVTGLDLVEEQIHIAQGEPLRLKQEDIRIDGWGIECRISAEDPYNNFMPSPGLITELYEPGGPGVRVDSGVCKGFEVPIYYDPMIAKLIAWGQTRDEALRRMRRALRDYKILGIHNNIPFHVWVLSNEKFIRGEIHTTFVESDFDLRQSKTHAVTEAAAVLAALMEDARRGRSHGIPTQRTDQGHAGSAWKLAGRAREASQRWRLSDTRSR